MQKRLAYSPLIAGSVRHLLTRDCFWQSVAQDTGG
jgi:hypothetical protein